jgi:hypothetical protein
VIKSENLRIGQIVEARFTNNSKLLRFKGKIVKINKNTALIENVENEVNGWEAGHKFSIMTDKNPLCSENNGIFEVIA